MASNATGVKRQRTSGSGPQQSTSKSVSATQILNFLAQAETRVKTALLSGQASGLQPGQERILQEMLQEIVHLVLFPYHNFL